MSDYQAPESDGDDDYDDLQTFGGRDGFIFVIDANQDMFDENESDSAKFRTCLECVESMAMSQIVNSEKNLIGIIVYNTKFNPAPVEEDSNVEVPKNMAIYLPMRIVSKETIVKLKHTRDSNDLHGFSTTYGHSDTPAKFADIMWLCSRMFSGCGYKLQSSSIFLFTNRDEPHPNRSHEYQQALIRANDLAQQTIYFGLVPMSNHFSMDKFYQEFVCTVNDEDPNTFKLESGESQIEFMKSRVYRKDYRKKCNSHLSLSLGNVEIGIGLFKCTRATKYPAIKRIMRETNEPVTARRNYIVGEFNAEINEYDFSVEKKLLPSEIRKSVTFGTEEIKFTSEETTNMSTLMAPGMKLLGFKPISKFTIHNHISPPYFIFYDETTIKGSAVLFRALWEKCLEKNKAAVCVITSRRKAPPKYVALIPQIDKLTKEHAILRSNGFRMIYLPCESNIRNLDVCDKEAPNIDNQNAVELFERIIKKLKFSYRPNLFDNPKLKKIFNYIESIAFDIEQDPDEEFDDSTNPDLESQDSKINEYVNQLTDLFGVFDLEHGTKSKRPATSENGGGRAAKVSKVMNDNIDANEINAAIKNQTLDKFSVTALKAYLTSIGVKGISKLPKPALIERIKAEAT